MERENAEGMSSQSVEVAKRSQGREVFKSFPSKAKLHEVVACAREFHFPADYQVYIPIENSHAAYPPTSFVAISPHYLEFGSRFPVIPYLLNLLNELKLAPFQLTPNSYAQLTSLTLLFHRNKLSPPSLKFVKFLFSFKSVKDELYYLAAHPSQYKTILSQGGVKGKSNVGDYKSSWFFVSCPSLLSLKSFSFALTPGKGRLVRLGLLLL